MEIVLLRDVKGLGNAGEIVRVSDGFARNFLIPQNLAKFADSQSKLKIKEALTTSKKKGEKLEVGMQKLAKKLGGQTFQFELPGAEKGKLYAGLKENQILSRIKESFSDLPDKASLKKYSPLKAAGEYVVRVEIHKNINPEITIVINPADA